ncbi:MAG: hypothetical protein WB611_32925 [Stellaceae bacterium]
MSQAVLAGSIWLLTSVAASPQSNSNATYTAIIEAICRQYAAAPSALPASQLFVQCMVERRCHVITGSSGYQCEQPGPYTWHGGGY